MNQEAPASKRKRRRERLHRLNDSAAKVLITDHENVGVVMDHRTEMPGLKRIIVTDGRVPGTTFWGDLLSADSPEFDVFPTRADPVRYNGNRRGSCVILYGTR